MTSNNKQLEIAQRLGVYQSFDPKEELQHRLSFIKNNLVSSERYNLILGISGGIDSTLAGRLAQLAVEQLRQEHYLAHFVAVRLPYGIQIDEEEAQAALSFIKADQILIVNIKKTCDETLQSLKDSSFPISSEQQEDFILGNIKARQRMVTQYAIANGMQGLVIGTDHAAETVMGFFTKFGDGACDIAPLYGLNKRRVKAMAHYLGAPLALVNKIPTADLETLKPQLPDEEIYGTTYELIDDYLEGKKVPEKIRNLIENHYLKTQHKREPPKMP